MMRLLRPFCSSCSLRCCGGCRYLHGGSRRWHLPCANTTSHKHHQSTCIFSTDSAVGIVQTVFFLPRDAMLARYLLSSCVRLSVRLSQAGTVSKRLDESSCVLAWRIPSTCPTPCCKEIRLSPKIRVLPPGTLSQTVRTRRGSRLRCRQNSSSSSTVELVVDTYTILDQSWLLTTGRAPVYSPLIPLYCDFLWICFYG